MLTALFTFIFIFYLIFIGLLVFGIDKVEEFKLQDLQAKSKFSVIIPFRNEATNLPVLLEAIVNLNYPKTMFEVILVDDDSEDNSVSIIKKFLNSGTKKNNAAINNIRIIQNTRTSGSPKKDAITTAIKNSNYSWIITTDADCILPKYWLDAFDECIQINQPNCIAAPVTYLGKTSFFNRFQTLDFLSLQGATIGGFGIKKPFMCNGANFAYRKSEFNAVNGFVGNDTISSGDDVLLLEKFLNQNATKVHYLKSRQAIVTTAPSQNMDELVQQRLRWASKTKYYNNRFAKTIGLVVFLGNLMCLGLIPAVGFQFISIKIAIALFVIKFCIDFLLLFKTSRFFKQENLLVSYLFSSFIYPFFNVYVAFLSFFKSHEWKGRTFKK
ncbi:glycosyltransferase family 2 protein [Winogradskyella bathintestinalis]|uniref:Glycosyltransferase n=1 Tax=Winogradskyella bathintestinalis TaxID=3035208 RepID=A0ABT7ZQH5_9FLAO|nr:glycosyltransferase [Winogradskyella bathintestinalis]MDN3491262.1 glycosyltransferase [Winogradskyella bathintestinalis]